MKLMSVLVFAVILLYSISAIGQINPDDRFSTYNGQIDPGEIPTQFTVYQFPHNELPKAQQGEASVRVHFQEILNQLGTSSEWGRVGIVLTYQYTGWVTGTGPNNFQLSTVFPPLYDTLFKVAYTMGIPLMIIFNGSTWSAPEGAFNEYWKTRDDGKYLMRYKDGQVNQDISITTNTIPASTLSNYLSNWGYMNAHNALILTNSPYATDLMESRLNILDLALDMFVGLDNQYPGVIQSLSADGEVCNFSFRIKPPYGKRIPLGYEDFYVDPFVSEYGVDEGTYFATERFTYETEEELMWYNFRSECHRQYIAASVAAIKNRFPNTPIYTHQILQHDDDLVTEDGFDFAASQGSALVPDAYPGYTVYTIWGTGLSHHDGNHVMEACAQAASKAQNYGASMWGALEFNPGRGNYPGSKTDLADYTYDWLSYLYSLNCRVVCPLSWISNVLDTGISGSGMDDGIKRFIQQGPSGTVPTPPPGPTPNTYNLTNYPNPFNPSTTINCSIPANSKVKLMVYNTLGKEVAILVNEEKSPGSYTVNFDGSELSSGVYLYTLTTGTQVITQKMLLIK